MAVQSYLQRLVGGAISSGGRNGGGGGGGWLRRYFRFRRDKFIRLYEATDRYPMSPLVLFDFANPDDAADTHRVGPQEWDGWRISDDRVIGGFSESTARLVQKNPPPSANTAEADTSQTTEKSAATTSVTSHDSNVPYLQWWGNIDTTVGLQSNAQRSGFAALRSPEFPFDGANLGGMYNALEVLCRTPNVERAFTLNLRVVSTIPDDIYQGRIQLPAALDVDDDETSSDNKKKNEFQSCTLRFSELRLTSKGREREVFRQLDDNIRIESIGLILMDGKSGDFQFDLARVRAVNLLRDSTVFEGPPKEA